MHTFNRRRLLAGAAIGAATTVMPGLSIAGGRGENDQILIYLYLRGGIDGLSIYAPGAGHPDRADYQELRPSLSVRLPTSGPNAMVNLPNGGGFGLINAAAPLRDLWAEGDLAIVHATGLPIVNRSHFEAQRFMELGTPGATEGLPPGQQIDGVRTTSTGWLTRHLASASNLPLQMTMPVVATESQVPLSLTNEPAAVTLRSPGSFDLDLSGSNNLEEQVEASLLEIYRADSTDTGIAGEQALIAQALVEEVFEQNNKDYNLAAGAPYPVRDDNNNLHSISDKLITLERLIQADLGLRIAQLDQGGWDDHVEQGNFPEGVNESSGNFHARMDITARAITAFWERMTTTERDKITLVLHSEFGRRAFNNADNGTDHGSGNPMLVLGGNVNGGQFFGQWQGLGEDELYQGADLQTTTDFRRILSEILIRRHGNNKLGMIFPFYYNYQPMGIVNGQDMLPDYSPGDELFINGFE
ncbi:MAG: DUF1501 domain-containing protein [Symploca sp. SIO2G7]|nr:DUF1501 domain-containing protein [Symploca sp. SIO2G7]